MIVCEKCGEPKENVFGEFKKDRRFDSGYKPICRSCRNVTRKYFPPQRMKNRKICTQCLKEKTLKCFSRRQNKKTEKGYLMYSGKCKKCCKENKIKYLSNPLNLKNYLGKRGKYREENKIKIHERAYLRNHTKEVKDQAYIRRVNNIRKITDSYVFERIHRNYGISIKTARKYPDFIESCRIQIKIYRLLNLKRKENESIKAS